MKKKNKNSLEQLIILIMIIAGVTIFKYFYPNIQNYTNEIINEITHAVVPVTQSEVSFELASIPEYTDKSYVILNENKPKFTETEYITESFETYSPLDILGRCGVAYANICKETMPPDGDKRGSISNVIPSGWKQAKYNGEYLYNRAHLIGWQLSDEDDNKLNLITGTRYFNVTGMLPFENMVDDYLENKDSENNHVLYRVTPIYDGDNLVASGVEMEAYSVEDSGNGVCFNVYVYNVQPGISIDYATGSSKEIK